MNINISTVSKLGWDVLYQDKIDIDQRPIAIIDNIYDELHERYPTLSDADYTLYWRYSKEQF